MRISLGDIGVTSPTQCVVGAVDPASGDTIASCPPVDTTAALTAIADQLAYYNATQTPAPAPTTTSSNMTMYVGIAAAIFLVVMIAKK